MFRTLLHWFFNFNFDHYRPANCLPDHCFCEVVTLGFASQPINSYSNIFYVLAGLYILLRLKKNKKSGLKMPFSSLPSKLLIIFGAAQILIGIGSFVYHSSFTFVGQEMDDDSIYFFSGFPLSRSSRINLWGDASCLADHRV